MRFSQVRVQRCGKSAPAASRGAGSVNPGWEQGRRDYGWSFTDPVSCVPLEVSGNRHPRQITALDFKNVSRNVWESRTEPGLRSDSLYNS